MSDKLHFDDLTKITCDISMLDDCTRSRLVKSDSVEMWRGQYWENWAIDKYTSQGTFRKGTEPKFTSSHGNCWAKDHGWNRPTLSDTCTAGSYLGEYKVTRVDGKLKSITWEAL